MHSPDAVTCSHPVIGATSVVTGASVVAGLVTSGVVTAAVTGAVDGGDDEEVDESSLHAATTPSNTTVRARVRLTSI
jgi:hypothetical protein